MVVDNGEAGSIARLERTHKLGILKIRASFPLRFDGDLISRNVKDDVVVGVLQLESVKLNNRFFLGLDAGVYHGSGVGSGGCWV